MKKSPIEVLEIEEHLQKLIDKGYGDFVDKILSNESKCYTRSNKLNRSGTCRVLGIKPKQLEEILIKCREILGENLFN